MWAVPVAMLVAFVMLLAVPDAATVAAQSVSVPYTETVIVPEISRAYSITGSMELEYTELAPERSFRDNTTPRNSGAVTADQDELSIITYGVTHHWQHQPRNNSVAWHNDDVYYAYIQDNDLYISMIDSSSNTETTWKSTDKFYPRHRASYHSPGIVDSSGMYYFLLKVWGYSTETHLIFRLDPSTGSLTKWNEKGLIEVGSRDRVFVDAKNNLYFAEPSGHAQWGYSGSGSWQGEQFDVPKDVPVVTLSSATSSDRLGSEYAIVYVDVGSRGAHNYGTLTAPDGTYRLKDGRLTELLFGNARWVGGGIEGVSGEYTATVQDRFGTATVSITLTEEQKVVQKSSPGPTTDAVSTVFTLANKLDPNTNQITTFYREDADLHMTLLEVDASGTMYFVVEHGTRDLYATGIAKFDQKSGTITTWPNIQCYNFDVAVAGDKIYCPTSNNTLAELDTSSNTLRQWNVPVDGSIAVDSTGTVFSGGSNFIRFVPSTGISTTFDLEDIHWVHVDSSGTLHAVQARPSHMWQSSVSALTIMPVQVEVPSPVPERVAVPDPVPGQTHMQDPTPKQIAEEPTREPDVPAPPAEPAATPRVICGPGTVMDSDGTCQLAREGGGCLIATAAHGTELAAQVQRLREVRQTILSSESGAEFMGAFNNIYYSFSPAVADMERQNPVLREAVRIALAPMLATLQIMEFADTEARSAALGILAISLNVAMYGSPAALAVLARRRRNARVRPKPLGRAARQ